MKTFRVWIRQFDKDNFPIGDLSRDIADDSDFPKKNDYDEILSYLEMENACFACLETYKSAWKMYWNKNNPQCNSYQ